MIATPQLYQTLYDEISATLPGNKTPWIKTLREQALQNFLKTGFPTTRNEEWRYTSLRQLEQLTFTLADNTQTISPTSASKNLLQQASYQNEWENLIEVVFINGQPASMIHSTYITSLTDVINNHPENLTSFLSKSANSETPTNIFTTLNNVFMKNGTFITVPENQNVAIHLIFLATPQKEPLAYYLRNFITLKQDAKATIIETYLGNSDSTYLTNTVTEVELHENATLTHYKLQNESKKAFHFGTIYVKQSYPNSQFSNHLISLGGLLSRSDANILLDAPLTYCMLNGLYYLGENQHMDHHTSIDHQKPEGTSREFYKGILDGNSRGVFNGKIFVRPNAQKTDSQQYNQNLLLSTNAEIDTKPQLEILADDIKCTHGATVGQFDEEALFYLRSRGLDLETARCVLIYAFFNDVIERMPHPLLREHVKQCL